MLAEPILAFIRRVETAEKTAEKEPLEDEFLQVNKVIAKAATFYEKVRYLIDYREEHTIRRSAIERMLKRRIFIEQRTHVGEMLLQEMADGQYLEKEQATAELADDIDRIVWRFLHLIDAAKVHLPARGAQAGGKISRELLSFAATEIDARLSPREHVLDEAAVEAFYQILKGRVSVSGLTEEAVNAQLYCASWRVLLRADNERLAYALWLLYVPEWRLPAATSTAQAGDPEFDGTTIAEHLRGIMAQIRASLDNQLQWQLAQKVKNESIYFHIIRDVVEQYDSARAEQILSSPTELDQHTRAFLARKYEKENERIQSSGTRAVAYLFLTKILVALVVEVPYEFFFLGAIHYVPLSINALFHPLLLFVLTRRVGALDEANTEAIIAGVHRMLYENRVRSIRIRNAYTRLTFAFGVMYLALVLFVFGALIGILQLMQFNAVSIALFLFFLALVSYFAFRIRYQARRWKVVENQGALALLASILAIPVVRTGRWLSQTFSSINVLVIIMDFIIETPFKRLLNFSNQFMLYLREKSEELR